VGKKFKTKQKKKDNVSFLPTELLTELQSKKKDDVSVKSLGDSVGKLRTLFIMSTTKGITDGIFRRYFPESVIWRFSEKIQLI